MFLVTETDELTKTVAKLRNLDERRAGLIRYRDEQMLAAKNAGASWATLQALTGLSMRGVQISLRRAQGLTKSGERPEG